MVFQLQRESPNRREDTQEKAFLEKIRSILLTDKTSSTN